MKKVLAVTVLIFMSFSPCFAENWVETSQKNFVDKDSFKQEYNIIKPENKIFSFWMKSYDINHGNVQNFERGFNREINYIKYQGQIDCTDRTLLLKMMLLYDDNDKEFYKHKPSFNIFKIKPGTIGEDICKIIEEETKEKQK